MTTWTTLPNGDKQAILTVGNSLTLPSDYTSLNFVECYGDGCSSTGQGGTPGHGGNAPGVGGGGGGYDSGTVKEAAGGGGAYAREMGVGVAGQVVSFHVGRPGCSDTWFSSPATVKAAGATGRLGGSTANSVGSVLHRGGHGPTVAMLMAGAFGAGGGAGPDGPGGDAQADGTPGTSGGGLASAGGIGNGGQTGLGGVGAIVVTYTPA